MDDNRQDGDDGDDDDKRKGDDVDYADQRPKQWDGTDLATC